MQKVLSTYDYAEEIAGGLWASIQAALAVGGGAARASIPEDRSDRQDWVREGLRLPRWACRTRPVAALVATTVTMVAAALCTHTLWNCFASASEPAKQGAQALTGSARPMTGSAGIT